MARSPGQKHRLQARMATLSPGQTYRVQVRTMEVELDFTAVLDNITQDATWPWPETTWSNGVVLSAPANFEQVP
jgi:hypothetical protein